METKWPILKMSFTEKIVLIVAPHVDDEVIGCGGIICKYINMNSKVYVVYMTNGMKGTLGNKKNMELGQIRREEALNIKKLFGVANCFFINMEDNGEWNMKEALATLNKIINEIRPDAIYIPPSNDLHIDHRKTHQIVKQVIKYGKYDGTIYIYEVWTPINPNVIVNITKYMDMKERALMACQSQIKIVDYEKMMLSLNSYRACFIPLPGVQFAEAFEQLNREEFMGKE